MFKFFANKNKKQDSYSLEEQILTLKQLGFTFNVEDNQLIDSLLDQIERDEFEEDPFYDASNY
ncbi:hypothetical protein [Brevibacillus sp. SYSU BS000544]|uniref:hypothetical protein n=1 Tax=Brevibacillus sp. SYSU BS000544 TaxID=3416443 RepID=UPI003CE58997